MAMEALHKPRSRELSTLIVGDILTLALSLVITLLVRYGTSIDTRTWTLHAEAFAFIFAVSLIVFFSAGLYDKHTAHFRRKLPATVLGAQLINVVMAVVVFYFVPATVVAIAPKVNLFIYLAVSSLLMTAWRMWGVARLNRRGTRRAVIIGEGPEVDEIVSELTHNPRYGYGLVQHILPRHALELVQKSSGEPIDLLACDFSNPALQDFMPALINAAFKGVQCVDIRDLYESLFNRIPLSLVDEAWLLTNVSFARKPVFDALKRCIDIVGGLALAIIPIIAMPFVWLVIRMDDGGPLFFSQERVGKGGRIFKVYKFRSMKEGKSVTRVGHFLRKSRIDELPQLLSVIKGDVSLIGPRPELPHFVAQYTLDIPFYALRHSIAPGLSGWAQLYHENHPHHTADGTETRQKLSYDLFYLKNRSLLLDCAIALKTIKILLSFAGK